MKTLIYVILFLLPHPDLKERLSKEEWEKTKEILIKAKEKGVDAPDYENLERFRIRLLERQYDTLGIPVILVEFVDNQAESSKTHFEEMLFSVNSYPTGSLTDYYLENSYNHFFINGIVSDWLMMPQLYTYYTNGQYGFGPYPQNAQGLARDAVLAADPYIDFSQFDRDGNGDVDAIFIVHAGPGAEETGNPNHIWSHAWYIPGGVWVDGVRVYRYSMEPENGRIGVFGHELGHVLGLPDLYDTDYSSEGLGNWSMMAGGSWGGNGAKPVHFDIWCKYKLGFLIPMNVTGIIENAVILSSNEYPVGYRLWTYGNSSPMYFLVEFRNKKGFDISLPGWGLLIFHVDENQPNNNNEWYPGHTQYGHYKVALEQADGLWNLEKGQNRGDGGDPYPGNTNNRNFDNYSIPDSKDYNFITTYVSVTGISDLDDTMYADLAVIPVHNLSLDNSNFPPVLKKDSSFIPKVYFSNRGFYPENFSITLKIDSLGNTIYENTVYNLYLSQGQKDSTDFPPFTAKFENGSYDLKCYISSQNEQMHRNDTIKARIYSYNVRKFVSIPHSSNLPLIDGVIMDNEWNDAEKIDISDFLAKDNKRNVEKAFAFFKNSDSIFYIGIILEDFTSGNDIINIIFDDNADGSFPSYPDSTEGEIKFQEVQGIFSLSYRPYYSNHSAGSWKTISLPFGADFTNSKRSYEIGIPIRYKNFALPEEIGVSSSTDTFGIFIRVRDGSSFDYIGWWPQDLPFSSYNNPSLYAKIRVEDININIEEAKFQKEFSFLIKKEKDFYRIILKFSENTEYELKLFDILGRNLWSFNGKGKDFEGKIFFKDFSKGIYFLKLESKNINKIKRIVFY